MRDEVLRLLRDIHAALVPQDPPVGILFHQDGTPIRTPDELLAERVRLDAEIERYRTYKCEPGEPFPSAKFGSILDARARLDRGQIWNPNEDMLL